MFYETLFGNRIEFSLAYKSMLFFKYFEEMSEIISDYANKVYFYIIKLLILK